MVKRYRFDHNASIREVESGFVTMTSSVVDPHKKQFILKGGKKGRIRITRSPVPRLS